MKIISFSDLHGDYSLYQWIVDLVNILKPDLVTICGDLFGYPSGYNSVESAQNSDAQKLKSILSRVTIPILFIMGNDDFISFNPVVENIHHIHSRSFRLNKFNFIGYEYSLPFVGGIFEKPEKEIESDLINLSKLVTDTTILISHSPAYGILDKTSLGINCGSKSILNFIRKQNIYAHFHGHVHESFGNSGKHFNCAAGGKKRAMLVNLEALDFKILS